MNRSSRIGFILANHILLFPQLVKISISIKNKYIYNIICIYLTKYIAKKLGPLIAISELILFELVRPSELIH